MLSNNFAMMARIIGDVSEAQIRAALSQIHLRHPALAPTGADVVFPLSVQTDCTEDAWIEVVKAELANPFSDAIDPAARFHLLQRTAGFDLIGCFNHGSCEGMSGIFVLRDILQLIGNPEAAFTAIPPQPMMETLIPKEILASPKFRLKLGMGMAFLRLRLWLAKTNRRFFTQSMPNPEQAPLSGADLPLNSQFVILPARLTAAQTSALAAYCKAEHVSVHAAICVAWLRAFISEVKQNKAQGGMVSSPVSLRQRFSSPVPDTSGQYLTIIETSIDCPADKDFWDVARQFKQKFEAELEPEVLFFKPMLFMKIFSTFSYEDVDILMSIIFSGPVKYEFSITNLGRVPISPHIGSLHVQALDGPLVNSSPFERTVGISTLDGQMNIAFLFRKSMMDEEIGQKLLNRAVHLLLEAAHAS